MYDMFYNNNNNNDFICPKIHIYNKYNGTQISDTLQFMLHNFEEAICTIIRKKNKK